MKNRGCPKTKGVRKHRVIMVAPVYPVRLRNSNTTRRTLMMDSICSVTPRSSLHLTMRSMYVPWWWTPSARWRRSMYLPWGWTPSARWRRAPCTYLDDGLHLLGDAALESPLDDAFHVRTLMMDSICSVTPRSSLHLTMRSMYSFLLRSVTATFFPFGFNSRSVTWTREERITC